MDHVEVNQQHTISDQDLSIEFDKFGSHSDSCPIESYQIYEKDPNGDLVLSTGKFGDAIVSDDTVEFPILDSTQVVD